MRRRRVQGALDADLLVFPGYRYRTSDVWASAFKEFRDAREQWAHEHEGTVLPSYEVNGYCPFDPNRFRKLRS